MAKVAKIVNSAHPDVHELIFYCPGCQRGHVITLDAPKGWRSERQGRWVWNGSEEKPTFSPAICIEEIVMHVSEGGPVDGSPRCHSWVMAGTIRYMDDSTHDLRGRTVALPNLEAVGMRGPGDAGSAR